MKDKITMVIFILVLGSILTVALVAVDNYTAPIIERNNIIKTRLSVLKALDINFAEDNINEVFLKNVLIDVKEGKEFYKSGITGDVAFEISGSGLQGPIFGIVAMLPDLQTIKGITIVRQEETPGLGGRIAEKEYLNQFNNKKFAPDIIVMPPGKAQGESEVDGITGATLSCMAFETILNNQAKKFISLYKGE